VPATCVKRTTRPLAAVLAVAAMVAAACSSSSSSSSSSTAAATSAPTTAAPTTSGPPKTLQTVSLALDWTPNTNHTGFYVADKLGYYKDAGIKLNIVPYSSTAADTLVGAGKTNFGISFQDAATLDVASGLAVTSVLAIVQHTATVIGVKATRADINSPKDLDGKTYAGFGLPYEVPTLAKVIQGAGGTGKFKSVTLNTSAYDAVYNGQADFTVPFIAWEVIEAKLRNEPFKVFKYSDYGFPDYYQVVVLGNNDWLTKNQDLAKRFVQATAKGYEYAVQNPDAAAQILINANPGAFNLPQLVTQSAELLAKSFYLDANGKFGTQTLSEWTGYSKFLYDSGVLVDGSGNKLKQPLDYSTLFSNAYIGS
jgi:ABC-type nitrate/sulfonate/bicarbonate transport system substrate-binding protein